MEHRSLSVVAGLIACCLATPALADDAAREADWNARLERAGALKAEAVKRQQAADAEYEAERLACQKKFLVNSCIDKARDKQVEVRRATRAQELEGTLQEREVRRERFAAKEAQRAAEAPVRDAERATRVDEVEARRVADEARREQAREDKALKADEGARAKAEREAAHRRKVEAHDAERAKRKAEADARAGEKQP
ncbi:hypothetical protein [Azonexus sp. R2A61]|uniref:hypothetical protein n=1 Tax=Azonexus sp. R2A61 TaxID=2744443 RepID=UPI001F25986C|nr:hypothetical protein [Azonexus sp. R2A61]